MHPALMIVVKTISGVVATKLYAEMSQKVSAIQFWDNDAPVEKEVEALPAPKSKDLYRKKQDTTRLTQYQFDYITYEHNLMLSYNKCHKQNKQTTQDLADKLNERMSLDKSRTAYARVWLKTLTRDSLIPGEKYFSFFNDEIQEDQ